MSDGLMHDWSLEKIEVNWPEQTAHLILGAAKHTRRLLVRGLYRIVIPQENAWGPSKYIVSSEGPEKLADGNFQLKIAMASGDTIEICAREIEMPEAVDQGLFTDRLPLGRN